MTRTVLVTGVGGFVGSHVVETLLDRTDWRIVGVDSFRHNGDFVNVVAAAGHATSRVTAVVHDLTVPFSERRLRELRDLELDYVINVASRSHVDESIADPAEFVLNNVTATLTVLELCRTVTPRQLVHISTDEVYGPYRPTSVHEHRPSSPYAASKAAQVDLVNAWARTYAIPTTVVSSANMFGERQCATAYIPIIVRTLLDGAQLNMHYHEGRPGERSYTYVRNVAERIVDELLIINNTDNLDDPDESRLPSTDVRHITLSGQRRVDNHTLANRVAEIAGFTLNAQPVDAGSRRPGYDHTYAALGGTWTPAVDFDEGLRRTVTWLLAHYGGQR